MGEKYEEQLQGVAARLSSDNQKRRPGRQIEGGAGAGANGQWNLDSIHEFVQSKPKWLELSAAAKDHMAALQKVVTEASRRTRKVATALHLADMVFGVRVARGVATTAAHVVGGRMPSMAAGVEVS